MEFIVTIKALIVVLLGIIYLMASIQLIMNGQRGISAIFLRYSSVIPSSDITEEDYVFAAVTIFLHIACVIMILIIFILVVVVIVFVCYFGIGFVRILLFWRYDDK
uniref:Uncharacterized protein n=1 Tax=Acrobeloides nanus TaxID=290746 RepID=A0A914DZD8_9BILA